MPIEAAAPPAPTVIDEPKSTASATPTAQAPTAVAESSIRVQVGVLDSLMNLAGELVLGRNQLMMGLVGTSHSELFFDDIRLERDNLLGKEGQGMQLVLDTLGRVRLVQVGARAVGKAAKLLSMMTDYAKERHQFGQPIGHFQLIQEKLADSVIEVNAARLLLLRAAYEIDLGNDARDWISMVKVHATETLGRVADRAVQLFGGMGYCKDLPIEQLYRDSRIARIYDGTSEIHRILVARGVLKKGTSLFDLV